MALPPNKFDYISVLAGGTCSFACSFCIGNTIREDNPPRFSDKWECFLDLYASDTKLLSISGSTSDPSLVGSVENRKIVSLAKKLNPDIRVSIHTRDLGEFARDTYEYCDEVVISLEYNSEKAINFFKSLTSEQKNKTRISVVITPKNKTLLEEVSFYESLSVHNFTVRKNVFDPINLSINLPHVEGKYGSVFYPFKEGNIAYWDYSVVNNNLNTRYLWEDNKVSEQSEWEKLF